MAGERLGPENQTLWRIKLEQFLEGERVGSIKVLAISDMALYQTIAYQIAQFPPYGGNSHGVDKKELDTFTQKAQLLETIRGRKYGINALEYRKACKEAEDIVKDYKEDTRITECITGRVFRKPPTAGEVLLQDLDELIEQNKI